MKKLLNKDQYFINLEEKLNTWFDNLVAADANSSRYDKYTLLNAS